MPSLSVPKQSRHRPRRIFGRVAEISAQPSDQELLHCAGGRRGGDAFAVLMRRYQPELLNYLVRLLRDPHRAEEVLQAAFLRIYQHRDRFQRGRRLRPWMYSIATHLAIDLIRSEARKRTVSLDTPRFERELEGGTLVELLAATVQDPAEQIEARELYDWLHRAVEALPEHLRTVITLVYFRGLKFREAAEALNLPEGTIKSRVHAALVAIARDWRQRQPLGNGPASDAGGTAGNATLFCRESRELSALSQRSNDGKRIVSRSGALGAAGREKEEVSHVTFTDSVAGDVPGNLLPT